MQIEKKGNGPWADVKVSCGAVSIAVGEEVLLLNCRKDLDFYLMLYPIRRCV